MDLILVLILKAALKVQTLHSGPQAGDTAAEVTAAAVKIHG